MKSAHVNVTQHQGVPVAHLRGEIDMSNTPDLRAALVAAVPTTASGLVVDLSETTYLDSAGVQLLLELGRRLRRDQQELRVVVPATAPVNRVLGLTKFGTIVPLHPTIDDAIQQMRPRA